MCPPQRSRSSAWRRGVRDCAGGGARSGRRPGVGAIRERSPIPLVADIHFDYRLALECVAAGCDKVRINPGNIGGEDRVKAVADACRQKGIPIRIGVNGGSLEKPILAKYGGVTPEALVESAFGHIRLLEKFDFTDICVSLKSSSVRTTMAAYRLMNQESDYPLHLGVTETGTLRMGTLKSAVGIGGLLAMGIGDTMRVSLSADPVEEVYAARDILKAAGVRKEGPELVSCPTCGRTRIDLIGLATQVEERLKAVCATPVLSSRMPTSCCSSTARPTTMPRTARKTRPMRMRPSAS